MSKRQVLQKLLALTSMIDSNRIRSGAVHEDEWADLLAAAQHLAPLPIAIADPPMVNMHVISYVARRHARVGMRTPATGSRKSATSAAA